MCESKFFIKTSFGPDLSHLVSANAESDLILLYVQLHFVKCAHDSLKKQLYLT